MGPLILFTAAMTEASVLPGGAEGAGLGVGVGVATAVATGPLALAADIPASMVCAESANPRPAAEFRTIFETTSPTT